MPLPMDNSSKRRKLSSTSNTTSLNNNNHRNQLGHAFGDLADTGLGLATCKSLDAYQLSTAAVFGMVH